MRRCYRLRRCGKFFSSSLFDLLTLQVVIKLYASSRATSRLMSFQNMSTDSESPLAPESKRYNAPWPMSRLKSARSLRTGKSPTSSTDSGMPPSIAMYQLQDKLKGIALRISMYPTALILINTIISGTFFHYKQGLLLTKVGDLHTAVNQGIHGRGAYHLVVLHRLLCGGRGVVFACVRRHTSLQPLLI